MTRFGSDAYLALMIGLLIVELAYWAARSIHRRWRTRPLSHRTTRRLQAEAEAFMRGTTVPRPAPDAPHDRAGAGLEPSSGSAVASSVEPPAPGAPCPGAGSQRDSAWTAGVESQPAPEVSRGERPDAGPDPLSAAALSYSPMGAAHPSRGGQGQTPVDVVDSPDSAAPTGPTSPRCCLDEVPIGDAAAGFPGSAAAPRSAA